jgi:pilus assembly protein CpaE
MDASALALLIQANSSAAAPVREALAGESRCKLQSVERVATALARIAGGGVDLVILDLCSSPAPEIEHLDTLLKLRGAAPQVPIVVVSDAETNGLIMRAIRAGTAGHVTKENCASDLRRIVGESLAERSPAREQTRQRLPDANPSRAKVGGTLVTLLGGKGGVGTTTVALSLAAALGASSRVILTEVRPGLSTLPQYFHPHQKARNLAELLTMEPAAIGPGTAKECLWPVKSVPGLRILFGPLNAGQCGEIAPAHARAVVKALSTLADFIIVDLPSSLSDANRAILQDADVLAIVAERDPFSIDAAKRMLEAILSWNAPAPVTGAVIVNRASLSVPSDLAEIEIQLAVPILGVIPPAADLCVAAQRAGAPVALYDAESLAGRSFFALAERITLR